MPKNLEHVERGLTDLLNAFDPDFCSALNVFEQLKVRCYLAEDTNWAIWLCLAVKYAYCTAHGPESDGSVFNGALGFFFTHFDGRFKVNLFLVQCRSAFYG